MNNPLGTLILKTVGCRIVLKRVAGNRRARDDDLWYINRTPTSISPRNFIAKPLTTLDRYSASDMTRLVGPCEQGQCGCPKDPK